MKILLFILGSICIIVAVLIAIHEDQGKPFDPTTQGKVSGGWTPSEGSIVYVEW